MIPLSLEQRISLIVSNAHSLKRAKDKNDFSALAEFFRNIERIASEGAEIYEESDGISSETEGGSLPPSEKHAESVRATEASGSETPTGSQSSNEGT